MWVFLAGKSAGGKERTLVVPGGRQEIRMRPGTKGRSYMADSVLAPCSALEKRLQNCKDAEDRGQGATGL